MEITAVLHNSLLPTHLANRMQSYYVRNWKNYNESLVRRGEILLDFDIIDNWNDELEEMNKNKEGRKFVSRNHRSPQGPQGPQRSNH